MAETERRPALMFSTSTDRIGTPSGQSYTGTVSKNLLPRASRSLAPYAGVAWSGYEDRARVIGGLSFGISPRRWSGLVSFDGVNLHPTFTLSAGPHAFSLLLTTGVRARRDPISGDKVPGDGLAVGFAWSVVFGGTGRASDDHAHGDEE